MRLQAPLLIALAVTTLGVQPRTQQQIHEGLLPFRNPSGNVEPPEELFADLQAMWNIRKGARRSEISFDDMGREIVDDPRWQRAYEAAQGKMFNMATVFGLMLRDSRVVNYRRLSAYGTFYATNPAHVFELIAFFPGEPEREIREGAFRRAIEYLRVHLPKNKPVTVDGDGEAAAGREPDSLYTLEVYPFVALLDETDFRDQAQGLWFLKEVMAIRPQGAKPILGACVDRLRRLLVSDNAEVRVQAREFLQQADPAHRDAPAEDAGDEALIAWLDAVAYDVFPPVRAMSEGLTDIYPSDDLDRIIEVGTDALERKSIGEPVTGRKRGGGTYRGFRIARLPEPLDKLRLPVGTVITSINGQPVATARSILDMLQISAKAKKRFFVEYVRDGVPMAMEYRLR